MIILVGSSKGGVGKSTVAVNLAAWIALHEGPTVLVDTDVQRHASDWAHDRAKHFPGHPRVALAQAYGRNVAGILLEQQQHYRYVVVDAGGRDSQELRFAARMANVMVSPTVASLFDLKGMRDTAEVIDEAGSFRGEPLAAFAFLNKVPGDKRLAGDQDRAREALATWPQVRTLKATLGARRPFLLCIEDGRAAFEIEMSRSPAGDELAALWSELQTEAAPWTASRLA